MARHGRTWPGTGKHGRAPTAMARHGRSWPGAGRRGQASAILARRGHALWTGAGTPLARRGHALARRGRALARRGHARHSSETAFRPPTFFSQRRRSSRRTWVVSSRRFRPVDASTHGAGVAPAGDDPAPWRKPDFSRWLRDPAATACPCGEVPSARQFSPPWRMRVAWQAPACRRHSGELAGSHRTRASASGLPDDPRHGLNLPFSARLEPSVHFPVTAYDGTTGEGRRRMANVQVPRP